MNFQEFRNKESVYTYLILIALVVFIIFKIPDLKLPYFWDELGVYSQAGLYLAEHGLSFLPSSMPPDLSRGHPLLFQFITGLSFKIFGKSVLPGHILALFISCGLVFSVYYFISTFFNRLIGFCAAILLICQPVFIAQSTLVLPEMLLTLMVFLAAVAYQKRRFVLFAIFSCLAIMTKESAIVLPFAAFAYAFILEILLKKKLGYLKWQSVLLTFSALFAFGIFLLIQRAQNGWFFFPLHMEYISFKLDSIQQANHYYQKFLFFNQGRYWWVKVFIVAGFIAFLKSSLKPSHNFLFLGTLIITAVIAFSSVNCYMNRYILVVFPFLVSLLAISIYTITQRAWAVISITAVLGLLNLHDLDPGEFNYDGDMGFKHHLHVEQEIINKLCSMSNKPISITAYFPVVLAIVLPNTGFKTCDAILHNSDSLPNKYLVLTSENGSFPDETDTQRLIFSTKESYAEGRIYELRP